jgi:hypothetical protein
MIKRLPRFAELRLQSICAEVGALCQEVDEDESGWDFLIEFEHETHPGPADTHPAKKKAFVQVKSAERHRLTDRVTLSNALRAAQSRQPWFIVLMVRSETEGEAVKVYATHVWEQLIHDTLKAVRLAENQQIPLNKRDIVINFDERTPDGNLVTWMSATIDAIGADYEQKKKEIYEGVGYESGYGVGNLSIEASSTDEISRNFLGLGEGLTVKQFSFTPARFGLQAVTPQIDVSAGKIHISPTSVADCEVRFRSMDAAEPVIAPGKVYTTGFPGKPVEEQAFRFSGDFFEMIWVPKGRSSFETNLKPGLKASLQAIEDFATISSWTRGAPVDVQVWIDGKRATGGTFNLEGDIPPLEWADMGQTIKLLRFVAGPRKQREILVSLEDLVRAQGLRRFGKVLGNAPFFAEFDVNPDMPEKITSFLYYCDVCVADWTFFALVQRPVLNDLSADGRRRISAGPPKFLEEYVFASPGEQERTTIKIDYDRHLTEFEARESPLGFGNLWEYIAANKNAG